MQKIQMLTKPTEKPKLQPLEDGENDLSWDMGIHKKTLSGDYVWDDVNRDGIQDSDEPGKSKILREFS